MSGWLRQQGLRTVSKYKTQEKDRIQLLTAGLSGESVLIGEEKVRANTANLTPGSVQLKHKYIAADMSNLWKSLVELTVATLASYGSIFVLRLYFPSVAFLSPTPRGSAVIIAGLVGLPLLASIKLLWARSASSKDWKVSWIISAFFLLTFYIVLSPSTSASTSTPEFWNLGATKGFADVLDTISEASISLGLGSLKYNESQPISTQAAQDRLKSLFSENRNGATNSLGSENSWLSAYTPFIQARMWVFQLFITLLTFPVALSIFIGIQRQVRTIFLARGNAGTSSVVKVLQYFTAIAMPLFVFLAWSPFLSSFIVSSGFYVEDSILFTFRRLLSIAFVGLQLALLRPAVQLHLDSGKDLTEFLLSMSASTPNRGIMIQANLRAIAKTVFVVALECACLPLLQFSLLFTNHWLTNSIYISTVLVSWPIAILLMLVRSK